jgi:hypothetical protein
MIKKKKNTIALLSKLLGIRIDQAARLHPQAQAAGPLTDRMVSGMLEK